MKIGEYVRTKDGRISKIYDIQKNGLYILKDYDYSYNNDWLVKSSPNIIDLIEVGDYVNGMKVTDIQKDLSNNVEYIFGYSKEGFEGETMYYEDDIKSIVTKECFKSMEYKVKE